MSLKVKKINNKKIIPTLSEISGGAEIANTVNTINETIKLDKSNIPIVIEMSKIDINIFDTDNTVTFSTNIDYPRSEYGFHHFIHNNKNKTEKLKIFEGKKKVYLVFNKFESNIDNYDKSINTVSKDFFSNIIGVTVPEILSGSFYKMWEILMMFNLIDLTQDKFVSAHLSEEVGAFTQATVYYRDTYCKKNVPKNDKYYAITMHPDDVGGKNNITQLDDGFVKHYQKEKQERLILKQIGGQIEEKVDLITGDGDISWVSENIQEQEAFRLIIAQVVASIKLQKKGGSFVCKFFETFTKTSLKIAAILLSLYEKVYWVKPLTSRLSNSEKYAVCVNFKFSDKDKEHKNIVKKMDELLKTIHNDKNNKIVDIFPNYEIPKSLVRAIIELNRELSNQQLKSIGEIISFVDREIYSGDEYHDKKEEQIKGATFWNNTFLPKVENLNKNKILCDTIVRAALDTSNKEIANLNKLLVHVENQN